MKPSLSFRVQRREEGHVRRRDGCQGRCCASLCDAYAQVEALDFALRSKDEASALSKLSSTKAALDSVLAAVL